MEIKNILMKTSAVLMSLIIIAVLVISGPAQAFTLAVDSNKDFVSKGEEVTFDISVEMNSNEETSLNTITLILDKGQSDRKECVFNINGNKLSQCIGVTNITKISVSNGIYGYLSGYGYGFRDKEVTYKVTLDTDEYSLGAYDIIVKAVIGSNVITQQMNNKVVIRSASTTSSSHGHSRGNIQATSDSSSSSKGTLKVKSGDGYTIMTPEDWHEMQIENIDADSVHVGISSDNKQELEIKMDETELIDLNADEKEDMEMSIWFLGKNEASIYAEVYDGKIVKDDKPLSTSNIPSQKLSGKKESSLKKVPVIVKNETESDSTNSYWFMILIFVLVNLIMVSLVGIVYTLRK